MSVNQNVPTCVAAGTNNGCRPDSGYRNNSQYSSVAESNYHGLHVSFVQRPTTWASLRVTYTLSKSMNDVGEAFFSSPIDPTDIMRDWGRSDDDQRHRLVINGTVNTSMAPADDGLGAHQPRIPGEQHAAGTTRRCRSTSRPASPTCRARPAVRSRTARRPRRTSTCGR